MTRERNEEGSFPDTSNGRIIDRLDFKHDVVPWNLEGKEGMRRTVIPVFKTFHTDDYTVGRELKPLVEAGMHVDLVTTREETPLLIAFQSYRYRRFNLEEGELWVMAMGTKVVLPEYQRKGIGTELSKRAIERHRPNVVTGETAIPSAYLNHINTGYISLAYPNDRPFPREMIEDTVRPVIGEANYLHISRSEGGLCVENYVPETRRPLEVDRLSDSELSVLEEWKGFGFKLERGDETRYWQIVDLTRVPHLALAAA